MQALSQLSYGPTMLRAGNHSDIDGAWEVVCAKKFARPIRQWLGPMWRVPLRALDECARRKLIDLDVVCMHECLIA
ncbi:hypothetical protein XarbCFBP8138_12550 [Xanthomonas arboricola]|nr:hypothetical protein XarbCFBP8138_12550 [Xanthomonas arboricola]